MAASRFCILLLFVFAIACSARRTAILSEEESTIVRSHGRSLKMQLNDYSDPTANTGHDPNTPWNRGGNRRGGGGHRP